MKRFGKTFILALMVLVYFSMPAFADDPELPSSPTTEKTYTLEEIASIIAPLPTGFVLWEANPRFAVWDGKTEDTSDDVVLDRATGLMWARDANLTGRMGYLNAMDYCRDLVLGNRYDWMLPVIEDLVTLIDPYPSTNVPALPSGHPFVNVSVDESYISNTKDPKRDLQSPSRR